MKFSWGGDIYIYIYIYIYLLWISVPKAKSNPSQTIADLTLAAILKNCIFVTGNGSVKLQYMIILC